MPGSDPPLSRRQLIAAFSAIMLATLLAALDQTVVATALPQIAATVRGSVRLATVLGAEDRSRSPGAPSARKRASHFHAVRSLIPADSAACRTVQPSLSIRSTNNRRPIGLSRALA